MWFEFFYSVVSNLSKRKPCGFEFKAGFEFVRKAFKHKT